MVLEFSPRGLCGHLRCPHPSNLRFSGIHMLVVPRQLLAGKVRILMEEQNQAPRSTYDLRSRGLRGSTCPRRARPRACASAIRRATSRCHSFFILGSHSLLSSNGPVCAGFDFPFFFFLAVVFFISPLPLTQYPALVVVRTLQWDHKLFIRGRLNLLSEH